MKRLLTCILSVALMSSCSNDENGLLTEQVPTKSEVITKSIAPNDSIDVLIMTNNDWCQLLSSNGEFSTNEGSKVSSIATRAWVDSRFVRGYRSCNPRSGLENVKAAFYNQAQCNEIGIATGIYITDFCEAKFTLYTGTGEIFLPTVSPNCGLQPDGDGIRGYSTSIIGNTVIVTTYLTHIKYDMLGRTIDKWYPVAPSNLIWNYDIYIP